MPRIELSTQITSNPLTESAFRSVWSGYVSPGVVLGGPGTYTFSNGDRLEGTLKDGVPEGTVTYTWNDGTVFEGCIQAGMPQGRGTATYPHGNLKRYEGQWAAGLASGDGVLELEFGDVYDGEFQQGEFHGHGVLRFANGDVYDGEYQNGHPVGHGKMLFMETKVIIDRNFNSSGIDRADTRELNTATNEIGKKKKSAPVAACIHPRSIPNPSNNTKLVSSLISTKKNHRAKTVRTQAALQRISRVNRQLTVPKKMVPKKKKRSIRRKRRFLNYDDDYLKDHRTSLCGKTKRMAGELDLSVFTNPTSANPIQRSKTMDMTINIARRMFNTSKQS